MVSSVLHVQPAAARGEAKRPASDRSDAPATSTQASATGSLTGSIASDNALRHKFGVATVGLDTQAFDVKDGEV